MSKDTKPVVSHSHPVEDDFNWSLEADWAPVEKKIGNFLVAVSMTCRLPVSHSLTATLYPLDRQMGSRSKAYPEGDGRTTSREHQGDGGFESRPGKRDRGREGKGEGHAQR